MSGAEEPQISTSNGVNASWRWATVLAVHPLITVGVLAGALLFGLTGTATTAFGLPPFIPLVPGGLTLVFLGVAHLYTPIYVTGLALDRRCVRASDTAWRPSRLVLLAGGAQIVYFVVPIIQAYGGETFEELVFGSVSRHSSVLEALRSDTWLSASATYPVPRRWSHCGPACGLASLGWRVTGWVDRDM